MQHQSYRQHLTRTLRSIWGRVVGAPNFSIIVFQMGKVGSKTVQESLIRAYRKLHQPVEIYHSHILCNFDNAEAIIRKERPNPEPTLAVINAGRKLRGQIDQSPEHQWKIITLVRDPIARNVGAYFQVLDEHIPNWKKKYDSNALTVEDVQKAFLNAGSIHTEPVRWFDEQLLPVFGVDVFSESFPRETGYKIYHPDSRISVLLIRLEDLERIGALAIEEFLGLKGIELFNTNIGDEKDYAELYRLFKQKPLPDEYIREMYSTKCAQTFYTSTDIAKFTLKWKGPTRSARPAVSQLPIIVYQMGKVGSKTIEYSIHHYYQNCGMDIDIFHAHFLNYLNEMEKNGIRQRISKHGLQHIHKMMELKARIDNDTKQKWKLISLVRDPVARNIASFFQALSVNQFVPDWKTKYQKGILKTEDLLEKFLSLGNDYHNYPINWFDAQMKPVFQMDVYGKPFPFEKGFETYTNGNRFELLVIRMEDLDRCAAQAISQYLHIDDFQLVNSNTSEEKDYKDLYNTFKALPLPHEYVSQLYNSQYAKCFYSASELSEFEKMWTKT